MKLAATLSLSLVLFALGCSGRPMADPPISPRIQQQQQPYERHERREPRHDTGSHDRADNTTGAFDYYLLTLSWSPEFCLTHPSAAECSAHPGFILHGLWPENNDGSYPQHCADAPGPTNPSAYRDIFADAGLLRHEWQTHGTCSGLSPDAYFNAARKALHSVTIPRDLAHIDQPLQLPPQQILADFARANPSYPTGSFTLSCGNNHLTAVTVCVDKDLHAIACSNLRSCRANVVKIAPPGATGN